MSVRYFTVLILCLGTLWTTEAQAASPAALVRDANAAFHQGHYQKAVQNYEKALQKKPESAIIHFNLGTAYYKSGRYDDALDHLQQAFLSNSKPLQAKAHYNAGNALYELGHGREHTELSSAISDMEKAVTQYTEALQINPKDGDALFNRAFVKKELKRIKKKQKEQKHRQKQSPSSGKKKSSGKAQKNSSGGHKPSSSPASSPTGSSQKKEKHQPSGQPSSGKKKRPEKKNRQGAHKQSGTNSQSQKKAGGSTKTASASGHRQASSKEMSSQEARDLLNNYEQTEEPRGLLNFMKGKGQEIPVLKNW